MSASIKTWLAPIRQAGWLSADRAVAYCRVLAIATVGFALVAFVYIAKPAWHAADHRPVATDFTPLWAGARLALTGSGADAYDAHAITTIETATVQLKKPQMLPYLYPPTFMLLCLPLATLPYIVALPLFLIAGYLGFIVLTFLILPVRWSILPICVFPAAIVNSVVGQTGFISAACFGVAFLTLDSVPALAGFSLGLLAFKPHLAICVPFALMAARRGVAFVACAATSLALVACSWLVLGRATWSAFLDSLSYSRFILESPEVGPKIITVFEAVRLAHGGAPLAYFAQAVSAIVSIGFVVTVARRRPGAGPEVAVIVSATLLCTPYALDYDLTCFCVPLAWLAGLATRSGWRPWEKSVLALSYLLSLYARASNLLTDVPLTPLVVAGLFSIVIGRARAPLAASMEHINEPSAEKTAC